MMKKATYQQRMEIATYQTDQTHNIDFVFGSDEEFTTQNLFKKLFLHPLDVNKPVKILIKGKSGTGKSYFFLTLMEILELPEFLNNPERFLEEQVIYDGVAGVEKINKHFETGNQNKVLTLMEGRMSAYNRRWHTDPNIFIGNILNLSRTIKPVLFFSIFQYSRQSDINLREDIDYIFRMERGGKNGEKVKAYLTKIQINETLDKTTMTEENVKGIIWKRSSEGTLALKWCVISKNRPILVSLPDKKYSNIFEKIDKRNKTEFLRQSAKFKKKQMPEAN